MLLVFSHSYSLAGFFFAGVAQGFGGMGQPFHRRYVVAQAVQVMETAVLNNAAGLTTFKELGAAEVGSCCCC